MRSDLAALYIDPRGPYPAMVVECYDLVRDARTYQGPLPVVAHPVCGPWSRLRSFCKGEGRDCGPRAVEQVRQFGGVLEHPEGSKLWDYCGLPAPFSLFEDSFGGRTVAIYQGDYGHPAPKLTWLYLVGVSELAGIRLGVGGQLGRVANQHSRARSITPTALARVLCDLAAGARV